MSRTGGHGRQHVSRKCRTKGPEVAERSRTLQWNKMKSRLGLYQLYLGVLALVHARSREARPLCLSLPASPLRSHFVSRCVERLSVVLAGRCRGTTVSPLRVQNRLSLSSNMNTKMPSRGVTWCVQQSLAHTRRLANFAEGGQWMCELSKRTLPVPFRG